MKPSTILTATTLATMLAAAPAFAWTNNQASENTAMPGQPSVTHADSYDQGTNATAAGQQLARNTVEQAQQKLQQNGFYQNGQVDGMVGPETRSAVKQFQQSKGLHANGQLDSQTLAALGVNQGSGATPSMNDQRG